jgi:hypothetical protein
MPNTKQPDMLAIYARMFSTALEDMAQNGYSSESMKKAAFNAVRYFNLLPEAQTCEEVETRFKQMEAVKYLLAQLTPRQWETTFPIDKIYDGRRWSTKDYFTTRTCLKEFGLDREVGEQVWELVWDYQNPDMNELGVNFMMIVSRMSQCMGGRDPLEEWFESHGVPLYRVHTDQQGKAFLTDGKGKVIPISKPKKRIPKHWKLIRGGQPK